MSLQNILIKSQIEANNSQFQKRHTSLWGVVVEVDGSIHPQGEENKVWIKEYNDPHSRLTVWCYINAVKDLPVDLEPDPNPPYLRVRGVYSGSAFHGNSPNPVFNSPPHNISHEYYNEQHKGVDVVTIYPPAIHMLRCIYQSSTSVRLSELTYIKSNHFVYFPGAVLDLQSAEPSAGRKRWVLIYLNMETNLPGFLACPEVLDLNSFNAPISSFPFDCIPSAMSLLRNPITLTQATINDCRPFFTPITSYDMLFPQPDRDGQLFIGHNSTFVKGSPLINNEGVILFNNNHEMIFV